MTELSIPMLYFVLNCLATWLGVVMAGVTLWGLALWGQRIQTRRRRCRRC